MKYLTFADLREKLGGRARSTIYLDVEAGRLPAPFKLGGRLYWRDDEVDEWLRCATVEAKKQEEDLTAASRAETQHGLDRRRMKAADKQGPGPEIGQRRIAHRDPDRAAARRQPGDQMPSNESRTAEYRDPLHCVDSLSKLPAFARRGGWRILSSAGDNASGIPGDEDFPKGFTPRGPTDRGPPPRCLQNPGYFG